MKEKFYMVEDGCGRIGIPWLCNYQWSGVVAVFQVLGFYVYERVGDARCVLGFTWGLDR